MKEHSGIFRIWSSQVQRGKLDAENFRTSLNKNAHLWSLLGYAAHSWPLVTLQYGGIFWTVDNNNVVEANHGFSSLSMIERTTVLAHFDLSYKVLFMLGSWKTEVWGISNRLSQKSGQIHVPFLISFSTCFKHSFYPKNLTPLGFLNPWKGYFQLNEYSVGEFFRHCGIATGWY